MFVPTTHSLFILACVATGCTAIRDRSHIRRNLRYRQPRSQIDTQTIPPIDEVSAHAPSVDDIEEHSDLTHIKIEEVTHFSQPTYNNLGGMGPTGGPPVMYFTNFTTVGGTVVDLSIRNATKYTFENPENNGLEGDFVKIGVDSGENVTLVWELFETGTTNLVPVTGLTLHALDFDTAKDGMSTEEIIVSDLTSFSVTADTQIAITRMHNADKGWEGVSFKATEKGNGGDNPDGVDNMTALMLARTVAMHFAEETTRFTVHLTALPKGHSGRNFMFATETPVDEVGVEIGVDELMSDPLDETSDDGTTTTTPATTTTTPNETAAIEAAEEVLATAEEDPESVDAATLESAAAAVVAASADPDTVADAASAASVASVVNTTVPGNATLPGNISVTTVMPVAEAEVDAALAAVKGALDAVSNLTANSTANSTAPATSNVTTPTSNATSSTIATTTPLLAAAPADPTTSFMTTPFVPPTTTMPLPTTTTTTLAPEEAAATAVDAAEPGEDPATVAVAAAAAAASSADDPVTAVEAAMHAAASVADKKRDESLEPTAVQPPREKEELQFVIASQVANTNETVGCAECVMAQTFTCSGYMRYGYSPNWDPWYVIGAYYGELRCTTEFLTGFGMSDPWPGHGKVCQCLERTGGICGATPLFAGLFWPILLITLVYLLYFIAETLGYRKPDNLFIRTLDRGASATYVAPMICSIFLVSFKIPDVLVADTGDFSTIKHRECGMIAILFCVQVVLNIYKEWDYVQQMEADKVFHQLDTDDDGIITRDEFMGYYWRKLHGVKSDRTAKTAEDHFLFEPNGFAAARLLALVMLYGLIALMMLRIFYQNDTETDSALIRSIADPVETGFVVAMRLGIFFFTTYIIWEVVQICGFVFSTATFGLAALSLQHCPMLVVLCVVHQAASLAGGELQPEWVTNAMWLAFAGEVGQWAGAFLMPMLFEHSLAMTVKGNVDLLFHAPTAMGYIRFLRWQCIATVYMAVYYLMKDLANMPSSPVCSVGRFDAHWVIYTLIATYYIGFFLAWLRRAYNEIRTQDSLKSVFGVVSWTYLIIGLIALWIITDILVTNGVDKEALAVGFAATFFAVVFTVVDHGVFTASGEESVRMSAVAHIYHSGKLLEWIPAVTCVILSYFLVTYH